MKGIDNIVGRIIEDASASAGEIAARAKAQGDEFAAAMAAETAEVVKSVLDLAGAQADDIGRREASIASLEGRKALLAARQTLVDEAFAEAAKRLKESAQNPEQYVKTLASLAKPHLVDGAVVLLGKTDFAAAGELLKGAIGGKHEVAQLDGDLSGGLIVRQGEIEINLTFAALLRQYREELEPAVTAALFG